MGVRIVQATPLTPSSSRPHEFKNGFGHVVPPSDPSFFLGRRGILQQLHVAWEHGRPRIIQIVADGGVGKSTIVWHWLEELRRREYDHAVQGLDWSFYDQGQHAHESHSRAFFDEALHHFAPLGLSLSPEQRENPVAIARAVADALVHAGGILVLDGVEPLQFLPDENDGAMRDPGMKALLDHLRTAPHAASDSRWLVIVTTRWSIPDICGDSTETIKLETLSDEDGADLLQQFHLEGEPDRRLLSIDEARHPDRERAIRAAFEAASRELGGHALALVLLASYLLRFHDGILDLRVIAPAVIDSDHKRPARHARRIMQKYEMMFDLGSMNPITRSCRQVLLLISLFDRPADPRLLDAIRAGEEIPGLTDGLTDHLFHEAIRELRRLHLLKGPGAIDSGMLDAHPLIRSHFGALLRGRNRSAFEEGHRRMFEHLRHSSAERSGAVSELEPLYRAVVHGCKAGLCQQAFTEVYERRIIQRDKHATWILAGSQAADLAALSCFFEERWTRISADLRAQDKACVFNHVGIDLRSFGRFTEAVKPFQAALDIYLGLEDYGRAATIAWELGHLYTPLGRLEAAEDAARKAIQ
jgi:hypothetical protein